MKCPKCGAPIEEGKEICFMCGARLDIDGGEQNSINQSQNLDFGTGGVQVDLGGFEQSNVNQNQSSDFGTGGTFFNNIPSDSPRVIDNQSYLQEKEKYNNRLKDYRNIEYNDGNTKKDMFDFFSTYKSQVKIVLLIATIAIGLLIFYKVASKKNKDEELIPIINETLYYKVNDTFNSVSNGSSLNNVGNYVLSGETGSSCTINVSFSASNSENDIKDSFDSVRNSIKNTLYDNNMNVIDVYKVPMFLEGQMEINGVKWYYLDEIYPDSLTTNYTKVSRRYIGSIHNGYYYNALLTNNAGDDTCNVYLDSFVRSLKFIDK